MKLLIEIDPTISEYYHLSQSDRFKNSILIAVEYAIKKQDGDVSMYGRLLFNRPDRIKVSEVD